MLFTLMLGMVVFALLYAWLLIHRFRVLWLENRIEDLGLDLALEERRREATDGGRWSRLREPVARAPARAGRDDVVPVALVLPCWALVLGAIAVLVVRSVQRGRRLSKQVPEEQRRWM